MNKIFNFFTTFCWFLADLSSERLSKEQSLGIKGDIFPPQNLKRTMFIIYIILDHFSSFVKWLNAKKRARVFCLP